MSVENFQNRPITFVIPVTDDTVFQGNFLLSPLFNGKHPHEIMIQRGYGSAAQAYNTAIAKAKNDLIIFAHQDIFLPGNWLKSVDEAIRYLDGRGIDWGVLGCYGVRTDIDKPIGVGRVYSNGIGIIGLDIESPEPVQTLDEIVLIVRKSSGLQFDPSLPHFHLYGTDICMAARERGMQSYAIPAFCVHNTNQITDLPVEFYECYRYIKKRWGKYLPIYTSCIKISCFDGEIYERKFRKICRLLLRKTKPPLCRVADPRALLEHLPSAEFGRPLFIGADAKPGAKVGW